jgi:phosphoribosylglycinamide formyltransferase-1
MKKRLAIFGSGKGSNFVSIYEALRAGKIHAEVGLVCSDVPGAGILEFAVKNKLPTLLIEEPRYRTRLSDDVESALAARLIAERIDWIVLAGYLRVVKQPLLAAFPGRIVNIHPSLLPQFPGLAAWKQALAAGVSTTGCTVHLVDAGLDTGPILEQASVPVLPDDTPESLHARIQEAEHMLYPRVLARLCAEGSAP